MQPSGPTGDWSGNSPNGSEAGNASRPEHAVSSQRADAQSGGSLDLRQVGQALRARWRFVFGCGAAVFALVMGYTLLGGMQFQASGSLYLGELEGLNRPNGGTSRDDDILGQGQGDIYSEIEILRSRARVSEAILASGLNVVITPRGVQPPAYWRWRLGKRDPALLETTTSALRAAQSVTTLRLQAPLVVFVQFVDPLHYNASSESGQHLGKGQLGEVSQLGSLQLMLLAGARALPARGDTFKLKIRPLEDTIEDALNRLKVGAPKVPAAIEPVKVLTLEFSDPSPDKAASFLRELMQGYLHERQSWKVENASAAEVFVSKQLDGMKRSLGATEDKLAEFRSSHEVVVQANQAEAVVDQLGNYEQQRIEARVQLNGMKTLQAALRDPNPSLESYLVGDPLDWVFKGLATSLLESQQQLSGLRNRLYAEAPQIAEQQAKVDNQLSVIRNYINQRVSRAQDQVHSLDLVIETYEAKLKSVPGAELGLAKIGRESEVYSRIYSYLLERQQQTQILKASTISKNRILDTPQPPLREDSPKLALRGASGLLGLLLGAFIVIIQSLWSSALRSEAEVRAFAPRVPIFANLPSQPPPLGKTARLANVPIYDVLARTSDSLGFAEGFRTLRTNLYDVFPGGHGRVVLVTSPAPSDGKTTTALSLASILAADRKHVLVIDADVRKPSHHALTGDPPGPGLHELLTGQCDDRTATHTVHITGGRFDSICAGSGAPVELLSSARMAELLVRARHHYDYVLLDSPSFPLLSDALILSRYSDFVLSVVRLGNTPRKLAEEHVRALSGKFAGHAMVVNASDVATIYGYPEYSGGAAVSARPRNADRAERPDSDSHLQ